MTKHLTYANVVATLALIVAVAGGSTAVAISAKKAPKNSVTSASIRDGSVTASDLARINIVTEPGFTTSTCAPNEKLTGGGGIAYLDFPAQQTTASDRLQRSYPVANGWSTQGLGNSTAYALCLSAKPGK